MKIDRHSTQPLYAQLKELIIDRISQQDYEPGQRIPSEMELCQELSLSRPTVRQAVAELVSEGILVIVKGKGTYVADDPERIEIDNVTAQRFSLLSAKSLAEFSNPTVETIPSEQTIDRLFALTETGHHPGYWGITWQQEESGACYATCQSLIPVTMFPDLGPDLRQGKRLIDILANKYAYLPQKTTGRILVRQARIDESKALDISRNAPVLVLTGIMTARSGHVCEINTTVMRADLVSLNIGSGRS
ncbi:MAG: GntR family transcriptional regulator [Clostridiaceae bacterium]|nr:GntR family transcriptional regulator [Clostridiaceae bacterium]